MTNSEAAATHTAKTVEFARSYVERLTGILNALDWGSVGHVVQLFLDARSRGRTIFFMGNGGSAATASHFANDMCVGASPPNRDPGQAGERPLFRAISLTANSSHLTCLANDFGYDTVFSLQLRNLMQERDVVVGISASGNSPNVVRGLEYANNNGGISVAIVGFDGGRMVEIAQHSIHVKSHKGEYGPVEDVHMILDHLISNYLART